jgi:MFS family permease
MLWVPVEKLFMTEIGFDAATIGVMAASYAALVPLIEIPSGVMADRWSRRGVLIISAIALSLTSLVGGLSYNIPTYIGSALILAVYFAMYSGTMDAIVYDTVLEEIGASDRFERTIGRVRAVESAALVAGALAGGLIAEITSARVTYFLTVPFTAVAIVALLRFREPLLHQHGDRMLLRVQIATTYRAITHTPRLLPVVALVLFTAVLLAVILEFGPLWLIAHDATAGLYGPHWAALTAMLGIGGVAAGRIALGRPSVLIPVIVAVTAASVALTRPSLPLAIGAQVLLVFLVVVANIRATQLLHDAVPSTIRGGVASGVSSLGWMFLLPCALGLGFLTEHAGVWVGAWLVVAITVLMCVALVVAVRPGASSAQSTAEALTTQLVRDVRRCLAEQRHEIVSIDCRDAVELVTDFLEGGLDPHAELAFVKHVGDCPGCERHVEQMRQTISLLRSLAEPELAGN